MSVYEIKKCEVIILMTHLTFTFNPVVFDLTFFFLFNLKNKIAVPKNSIK